MNFWFVFEITTYCDKKCVLCCNDSVRKKSAMSFSALSGKLEEIRNFCAKNGYIPHLVFTGGESFLYRDKTPNETKNLKDVIVLAKTKVPNSVLYIKTSGFTENKYLDLLLNELLCQYNPAELKIRLGINLYQKSGSDTCDRLAHMLDRLLPRRETVPIDTIYDKDNLAKTCSVMEQVLCQFGFISATNGQLLKLIDTDPGVHRRLKVSNGKNTIYLDMGPSYSPRPESDGYSYFEEKISGPCATIEKGPMAIYYNSNFNLIHCNDSFVDARISPIDSCQLPSLNDQQVFLQRKFAGLKEFLKKKEMQFKNRKERCFFCTKFVMSDHIQSCGVIK